MKDTTKQTGDQGEEMAVDLLTKKGFEILERNYRFGKGEIDIIARDPSDNYLVFVEVKLRHNLNYGEPEYAITKSKQNQIKKIANAYLFEKEINEIDCRFDVISILLRTKETPLIEHYENAFY